MQRQISPTSPPRTACVWRATTAEVSTGVYNDCHIAKGLRVSAAHSSSPPPARCTELLDKTLRSLKRATSHKHWPVHEADCVVALVAGRGDDASEHVKVGKQIFTTSGRMLDRVVFGMRDDAHGLCDKPSHFVFATDQTAAGRTSCTSTLNGPISNARVHCRRCCAGQVASSPHPPLHLSSSHPSHVRFPFSL